MSLPPCPIPPAAATIGPGYVGGNSATRCPVSFDSRLVATAEINSLLQQESQIASELTK